MKKRDFISEKCEMGRGRALFVFSAISSAISSLFFIESLPGFCSIPPSLPNSLPYLYPASTTHPINQVDSIHQELVCRVSEDARGFRIKMNAGIAGHVSTTGESLNIGDAYLDPRFNQVRV
jgi:hypothetical protein